MSSALTYSALQTRSRWSLKVATAVNSYWHGACNKHDVSTRFFATPPDAREIREKEKRERTPRNAKVWKKLDCPLPSAPVPCVSAVSRVLSPFPPAFFLFPQSRDLLSLFSPPSSDSISLSSLAIVRLHTVCRLNRKGTHDGEKAPVENRRAMKRTSSPTLYRY